MPPSDEIDGSETQGEETANYEISAEVSERKVTI